MSALWSKKTQAYVNITKMKDYCVTTRNQTQRYTTASAAARTSHFWHEKQTKTPNEFKCLQIKYSFLNLLFRMLRFSTLPFPLGSYFCFCVSDQILAEMRHWLIIMYVPGVCYGDTGSEVETEGNGMLHCRVGSLFTGRSSFHPGEPREGLAGLPTG